MAEKEITWQEMIKQSDAGKLAEPGVVEEIIANAKKEEGKSKVDD